MCCYICVEYRKGKLTLRELQHNLYESSSSDGDLHTEHVNEMLEAINEDIKNGRDLNKTIGE